MIGQMTSCIDASVFPCNEWLWGGSHRLWARSMDLTVNGEGSSIERPVTDHNFSRVIDTDQVAGLEHREVQTEGVHPEPIGELRVADGDVPGSALVVAELGEQPEARGQTLLAVEAFVFDGFEGWKQVEGRISATGFLRVIVVMASQGCGDP